MMSKVKERVRAALDSLKYIMESHDGFAEIGEISDSRVEIYYSGKCADCDSACIEDAIKEKVPGIEVVFRQ